MKKIKFYDIGKTLIHHISNECTNIVINYLQFFEDDNTTQTNSYIVGQLLEKHLYHDLISIILSYIELKGNFLQGYIRYNVTLSNYEGFGVEPEWYPLGTSLIGIEVDNAATIQCI